jgi:hypothetical protein
MFRTLFIVLAVLFVLRLVSQFLHAVIVGMRGDSGAGKRGAGVRGNRPPGVRETRPPGDDSPARRPAVDRARIIDVDYTEVEKERAAGEAGKKR